MGHIEFTEDEIRAVWKKVFDAEPPGTLTIKELYAACLSELSPEGLREELRCL